MAVHHFAHAQGKGNGYNGRQAFGDGGDGKADGDHEHLDHRAALQNARQEHQGANSQRCPAERFPKLVKAALEGGLLVVYRLEHTRDHS